jgi:hypothetical protein
MTQTPQIFHTSQRSGRAFTWGDLVALAVVAVALYAGARLAFNAPAVVTGPDISLAPSALPWYTLHSVGRMALIATFNASRRPLKRPAYLSKKSPPKFCPTHCRYSTAPSTPAMPSWFCVPVSKRPGSSCGAGRTL